MERVNERAVKYLDIVVRPAMSAAPLGLLSDGMLVSWRITVKSMMVLLIIYPGAFAIGGLLSLNRRELALPGSS